MLTKEQKKMINRVIYRGHNMDRKEMRKIWDASENDTWIGTVIRAIGERNKVPSNRRTVFPELVNSWVRHDCDSWKSVFVVDADSKEKAREIMDNVGFYVDGSRWTSDYDCTGRAFYYPMDFHVVGNNRVIVTQRGGLDV